MKIRKYRLTPVFRLNASKDRPDRIITLFIGGTLILMQVMWITVSTTCVHFLTILH